MQFPFCSSKWLISNDLSSRSDCSAWSNLLSKPSIKLFSSVTVFFSSTILVFLFHRGCTSICSCAVFLILLNCLPVFSYSYLSVVRTIILNSLPGDPLELYFLVVSCWRPTALLSWSHASLSLPDPCSQALESGHWDSSHSFQTLQTDFRKGDFTAGGGVLQGAVSPCPEVQDMGWLVGSGHCGQRHLRSRGFWEVLQGIH